MSQKKVPEYKIVFAGGDGAAARGASNPAISYLQPRLCSTDLIESVAIWALNEPLDEERHVAPSLRGEPRRSHPGAAQGSGSDRWTTDKARDGNVPNCQGAVRISRLGVHFNTRVGE